MSTLIIAPLQIELDALVAGFAEHGHLPTPGQIGRLPVLQLPSLALTLACGGHGKTQFGVQTQHLLDHAPAVEAVICAGAAGALDPAIGLADLVLAAETVEHDYTQRFRPHPLPRFPGDPGLLAALGALAGELSAFRVFAGIVASGDEDVIELERAAALRQATEACAVAWEGAGGARACRFSGARYLELRAITDTADHQAPVHFAANLQRAMANVATLLTHWRSRQA
ncbi:MAG: hypothetical protein OHK0015_49640 [Chloroflexi bacterium OHK40]